MKPQKMNLLLDTDKVFKDELCKLMPYPPQWMQPYDLYKSGYTEKNLAAVMVTISDISVSGSGTPKSIEIELSHMGTDPKKRERHLSIIFVNDAPDYEYFLKNSSFGTKNSIPKAGDITKLFCDSPYVLQKSVMVVLKYLQSKKLVKKSDFFEGIWHAFELNKKATVPEFMNLVQNLLK